MKRFLHILCWMFPVINVAASGEETGTPLGEEDLLEILVHIDKWYLSDAQHFAIDGEVVEIWVEGDNRPRRGDDRSEYIGLTLSGLNLFFQLKQADYRIEELDLRVRNEHPKVVAVHRADVDAPGDGVEVRTVDAATLRELLYQRRHEPNPLPASVLSYLRETLVDLLRTKGDEADLSAPQHFHVAPVSDYSNDIWVYWVEGRKLILFSSDIDFDRAEYWLMAHKRADFIDLDEDVVTTLHKVPGSNAYVTKSWAGRILFHCMVEGRAVVVRVE